jgi:hypothetical protein
MKSSAPSQKVIAKKTKSDVSRTSSSLSSASIIATPVGVSENRSIPAGYKELISVNEDLFAILRTPDVAPPRENAATSLLTSNK